MLVYGTEMVAPIEIGIKTYRIDNFQFELNDDQLRTNLDLLKEHSDRAQIKVGAYHHKVAKYHNSKVLTRKFKEGDWVLKSCRMGSLRP